MFQRRTIICLLVSSGLCVVSSLTTNMGIAIVSMTRKRNTELLNGTFIQVADFEWDSVKVGYILSSFFYGHTLASLLGGILSARFGGRNTLGIAIVCNSLCNILTPTAARHGIYSMLIIRIVIGLFEGVSFPCMHSLYSKWAPPDERSRMVTLACVGADIGNISSLSLYGVIAYYLGWDWLFYFPGMLGLLWSVLWFTIVKDDPSNDPKIEEKELRYLQNCLGVVSPSEKINYPWKQMMSSKPIWAIILGFFSLNWGFFTVYIGIPIFLRDIFHLNEKQIGYSTSIPFVSLPIMSFFAGMLSDYMVKHKHYSITTVSPGQFFGVLACGILGVFFFFNFEWMPTLSSVNAVVRKLFCCSGMYCASITMLLIPFSNSIIIITMSLNIILACQGLFNASLMVTFLDVAPKYAGMLSGIIGTVGSFPSIITPTITGYIVKNGLREEWNLIFWSCAILYVIGGTGYLFYGSGKVQAWSIDEKEKVHYNKGDKSFYKSIEHLDDTN